MKKVLIITYYWPPAGGPGVQRVVRFAKHLPQFGWQPIVLTVKHPTSPVDDESLLDDIAPESEIHKTNAIEPFSLYNIFMGKRGRDKIPKDAIQKKERDSYKDKISRMVRANIFIPDARVGWIPWIIREGSKIIKSKNIEVIFSTSPPHSLQIGAKHLAKKHSLKWIVDFRDPWVDAYWEKDLKRIQVLAKLNKKMEQAVLIQANKITTPSEGYVPSASDSIRKKVIPIYTGFDTLNREKIETDSFNILFLGNLGKVQSPKCMFLALNNMSSEMKSNIQMLFVGKVFDDHRQLYDAYPEINITEMDFLPFREAMEFSRSASLLLFIVHETSYSKDYIPVKIFDYLSLRKPILALGNGKSKIEQILVETGSGELIEKHDIKGISNFIKKKYSEWEANKYVLLPENQILKKYETKDSVEKLVSLFEE